MKKEKSLDKVIISLTIVLAVILFYNQIQINYISNMSKLSPTGLAVAAEANKVQTVSTAQTPEASASGAGVIPKGVPKIYGNELQISYDDISPSDQRKADATIRRLASFDETTKLNQQELQRYIGIASEISCEYCCGAPSIIFSNGQAACGCSHSYAMRGLAKYLIKNHPNEFTDEQLLEELGKWKVLFFPGIHAQKAAVLKEKGVEINYINLASNKYRGIEKGASGSGGSMVGGC